MAIAQRRIQLFDVVNYLFFTVLCLIMVYPFWHTAVGSFMTFAEYTNTRFLLFPSNPTIVAYRQILEEGDIYRPFINTVFVTMVHTVTAIFATSTVQSVEYAGDFVPKETIKLANTVVSIVPIIMVYPFVQRYFTKGVMIGAVKG